MSSHVINPQGQRFGRLSETDVSVLDLKKLASLFAAQKYTDRIASAIAKRLGEVGIVMAVVCRNQFGD